MQCDRCQTVWTRELWASLSLPRLYYNTQVGSDLPPLWQRPSFGPCFGPFELIPVSPEYIPGLRIFPPFRTLVLSGLLHGHHGPTEATGPACLRTNHPGHGRPPVGSGVAENPHDPTSYLFYVQSTYLITMKRFPHFSDTYGVLFVIWLTRFISFVWVSVGS